MLGPLVAGGPAELAHRHEVGELQDGYADACEFCYRTRKSMRAQFPAELVPDQMYGSEGGAPAGRKITAPTLGQLLRLRRRATVHSGLQHSFQLLYPKAVHQLDVASRNLVDILKLVDASFETLLPEQMQYGVG